MKISLSVLALALLGLFAGGCNRHSWEDTKEFYKEHGDHGGGEKHGGEKHGGEAKDPAHP